jgi:hypothetical protein
MLLSQQYWMLTNATIKNQWYIQMFILQQVHLIFP